MDPALAARIQEWDASPISGGYRGLRELADASFSGAVTTGSAWLFMLNGRVVGVVDGTLSSFESADATAHKAPDPTLPLLFAMQEQGGETQAKYYTDDNPLPAVHETLSEANFTGYIELSENVLSGDYYVVYYGGKSMSAAFVGNAERLVTGEDAFHQAADEVGIYEVIDVDLDVREVPEPSGGEPAPEPDEPTTEPADDPEPVEPEDDEPATESEPAPAPSSDLGSSAPEGTADDADDAVPATDEPETASRRQETPSRQPASGQTARGREQEDPFSEEEAWREARTIPALDPDETDEPTADADASPEPAQPEPAEPEPVEPEPTPEPTGDDDRIAELEDAIESQSETIAELESRLESTSEEAEQLREEREALEAQLESAREASDEPAAAPAKQTLDPETALDQTDLFIRYNSKGQPTLESAHDGEAARDAVVKNLRIDHHTRFEEDEVTVRGTPFDSFLTGCLEYRFVNWLVTELLFEIHDTGSQRGMRDLFDVIPLIDRAEFQGTVTWRDQDEGETNSEEFDVVCRDRMGKALVVANLNDARDPATSEMMETLIESASSIAEGIEDLGGAFMVTSSFFRPDALETASEATGGGLLSREKRWSYVKLRRRHGYHLCLVEARGDAFHVAVPEM